MITVLIALIISIIVVVVLNIIVVASCETEALFASSVFCCVKKCLPSNCVLASAQP